MMLNEGKPGLRALSALFLSLMLLVGLVSSCLLPEKFEARIHIENDGRYSLTYEGILTSIYDRISAKSDVPLFALFGGRAKEMEERMLAHPNFRQVRNIGNGQYEVLYQDEGYLGSRVQFLNELITITPLGEERVEIRAMKLEEEQIRDMRELDLKVDGRLKVTTNARVLEHNAKSTPWLFGLVGSYKWEIKSADDPAPYMLLQYQREGFFQAISRFIRNAINFVQRIQRILRWRAG